MISESTLECIPFADRLNASARRELAARSSLRRFAAGEILWRAGAEPHGLLIILEGQVRVTRAPAGRQHVIHTEGPGGTLGDVPFFAGGRYPATAAALRETLCISVSQEALAAAIGADPHLAFVLLERLAKRVRELVERLDQRTTGSVRSRLAQYLLERARATEGEELTLGGSQAAVAEELGTVREVIVRELRRLREAGVLRSVGRGRLVLVTPGTLRRIALNQEQ